MAKKITADQLNKAYDHILDLAKKEPTLDGVVTINGLDFMQEEIAGKQRWVCITEVEVHGESDEYSDGNGY
jgi:hypothetical protein